MATQTEAVGQVVVWPPQRETASVATQAAAAEEGLREVQELRGRAGLLQAELLRAVEALEAREGEAAAERERAAAAAAAADVAAAARIEALGAAADAAVAAGRCARPPTQRCARWCTGSIVLKNTPGSAEPCSVPRRGVPHCSRAVG